MFWLCFQVSQALAALMLLSGGHCLPAFLTAFLLVFLPSSLPPSLSPSLPFITEYRHGDKTVETEELASLFTRLEETKPSLIFSKNTNSPLYSSVKMRYSPIGCLCYKHYKKLQFIQKIKTYVPSYMHFPNKKGRSF